MRASSRSPRRRACSFSPGVESGAPAVDLSAADFDIKESGVARQIVAVRHADEPMRVVVLVDNSDAAVVMEGQLRAGLHALVDGLPDSAEVALVTVAGGYELRLAPTTSRQRVASSIDGLHGETGMGTLVAKSLLEAETRVTRNAADRWPVFVIVSTDAAENPTMVKQVEFDALSDRLQRAAATVHAVVLTGGAGNSGASKLLDTMARNLTENSGGLFQDITNSRGLRDALTATAARMMADWQRISAGYEIEYAGSGRGDAPVEVGTSRPGVSLVPSLRRVP